MPSISLFDRYDDLLNLDCSVNYWYDSLIDEAGSILENFEENDWIELSDKWSSQDSLWKEKCAATLSDIELDRSLSILLSMLDSEDGTVLETVADSLNSQSQMGKKICLNPAQFSKLSDLSKTGKIMNIVVSNLLNRLDDR